MSNDLNNASSVLTNNVNKYKEFFRTQSVIRSLPETYLITSEGDIILKALPTKMIYYPLILIVIALLVAIILNHIYIIFLDQRNY